MEQSSVKLLLGHRIWLHSLEMYSHLIDIYEIEMSRVSPSHLVTPDCCHILLMAYYRSISEYCRILALAWSASARNADTMTVNYLFSGFQFCK